MAQRARLAWIQVPAIQMLLCRIEVLWGFIRPLSPHRGAQFFVALAEAILDGGPHEINVSFVPSLPYFPVFLGVRVLVLAARLGGRAGPGIILRHHGVYRVSQVFRRNAPIAFCRVVQLGGSGLCLLSRHRWNGRRPRRHRWNGLCSTACVRCLTRYWRCWCFRTRRCVGKKWRFRFCLKLWLAGTKWRIRFRLRLWLAGTKWRCRFRLRRGNCLAGRRLLLRCVRYAFGNRFCGRWQLQMRWWPFERSFRRRLGTVRRSPSLHLG